MVPGDKPNFYSCSRTSGILALKVFCEVGVVPRVSLVISGGASLDGGLSVALHTSAWLAGTRTVSASSAGQGSPMLDPPAPAGETS